MDTDVVVACAARSARSICGCHCCGRVMRPADAPEEEPNNLIAYDFVNDPVMSSNRIGCQLIEAIEE
jgi:hypothetical protein